ncbi:MAG: MFS transporter [Deltaproteobacteria bacterium]|nr:MFS transporter [Deltaproteobacteria bacterium]
MKFVIPRRWAIFFAACLLFILSQFYRASIAVITPDLISDLGLDTRGLSLISAAFFYAFAVAQIPITMYIDALGPRMVMTGLSLLGVAGALVFAGGGSIGALVAGRLLLGAGMACNLMGTLKLITLWFGPQRFATLSALVLSFGTLGNMTAATPLVLMVQSMGWRMTFMVFSGINLLLTAMFFIVAKDRPDGADFGKIPRAVSGNLQVIRSNIWNLLREKDYWIISLTTFCRYGIFAAVQALWAGPYLMTVIGISQVAAGNILLLMGVGMIVGSPITGWFSDSLFRTRKGIVISGLGGMALVLAVLALLGPNTSLIVLSLLFFSFGCFTSTGQIVYAHIKERMPIESAGAAMTGVNFFTMIGVAVFLQGLGSLMQWLYPGESLGAPAFRVAFLVCGGCLLITVTLYCVTVETLGKRAKTTA